MVGWPEPKPRSHVTWQCRMKNAIVTTMIYCTPRIHGSWWVTIQDGAPVRARAFSCLKKVVEFNGFNGRYNELVNGCSCGLQTNIHISLGGSHPFSVVHPENHPTYQLRRNRIAMMFTTAVTGRDDPVPGRIEMAMKRTCRMAIDGYRWLQLEDLGINLRIRTWSYVSTKGKAIFLEWPLNIYENWMMLDVGELSFFHRFPFFPQQKRYNI